MARAVDLLDARLRGLLSGAYTSGGRYVAGATFTEALPVSSPGAAAWQDVPVDRTWDVVWGQLATEDGQPVNSFQGPHVLVARATLRVQYALDRTGAFEPPPGDLGLPAAATRKALGDAEALHFIFGHAPAWSGVAIGCTVGEASTQVDGLRLVLSLPLLFRFAVSAAAAPGWGS